MRPKAKPAAAVGMGRAGHAGGKSRADGNGGPRKLARSLGQAMAQQETSSPQWNGSDKVQGSSRLRPGHVSDSSMSPSPGQRGGLQAYDQGQGLYSDRRARSPNRQAANQLQQRPNVEVKWSQDASRSTSPNRLRRAFGSYGGTAQGGRAPPSPGSPDFPVAAAAPADAEVGQQGKGRGRGGGKGAPQAIRAQRYGGRQMDDELTKVRDRIQHAIAHNPETARKTTGSRGMLSEPELRSMVRKQLKISHKEVSDTQLARLMDAYDVDRNGRIGLDQMMELPNEAAAADARRGTFDFMRKKTSGEREEAVMSQAELKRRLNNELGTPTNRVDFGLGDRLDATKWGALRDQQCHGGYYKANRQFSEELQLKDQKTRDFDEMLLAVTTAPGSPQHKRSTALQQQQPATPDRPIYGSDCGSASARGRNGAIARPASPMPHMGAAFTDRSLRMREEKSRITILGDDKFAKKAEIYEEMMNAHIQERNQRERRAAGQISTLVQSNRMPTFCGRDPAADSEAGDEVGPLKVFGEEHVKRNNPLDSSQAKFTMQHVYYDFNDLDKMDRDCAHGQDVARVMCRKRRVPAAVRSLSEDCEQWGAAAGFYRKEPPNCKNVEHSVLHPCDSVGKIVPGLTEGLRGTAILTETFNKEVGKKGESTFSKDFSPFVSRMAVQANAPLLRYEQDCQILRSGSCPPDLTRSRWNPLTGDGDPHGHLAHLEERTHEKIIAKDPAYSARTWGSTGGSSVRSPSQDSSTTASGAPHSNCAGVSSHTFSERKYRQWRGGSPKPLSGQAWDSTLMEQAIGNWGQRKAIEEREFRLGYDKNFADVCRVTDEIKADSAQKASRIKSQVFHQHSHQVAHSLQWPE